MRDNPYAGVNAHLNSLLQTPGSEEQPSMWPGFHGSHITYIVEALNEQLPDGYIAISEQSLQVRYVEPGEAEEVKHPAPDITIFHQSESPKAGTGTTVATPTWRTNLAETLEHARQPRAATIRRVLPQHQLGPIVTRIEVLSPTNKRRGPERRKYLEKRLETLQSGVPLVEIDYLHETPSPVNDLPVYPDDEDSYPYHIIVSDPRPDWHEGEINAYGFHIDEAIKLFPTPLEGRNHLVLALNPVYNRTFHAGRWGNLLDNYTQLPDRFETYNSDDQQRIRAVMERVQTRLNEKPD